MKYFLQFIIQIIIFILLRYLSAVYIFLQGVGPSMEYSIWDYVPALLIQVILILFLILRAKRRNEVKVIILYIFVIVVLILLFLGRHFNLIPQVIVPA